MEEQHGIGVGQVTARSMRAALTKSCRRRSQLKVTNPYMRPMLPSTGMEGRHQISVRTASIQNLKNTLLRSSLHRAMYQRGQCQMRNDAFLMS